MGRSAILVKPQERTEMAIDLRHTLAALAYRLGKVLREVPPDFGNFQAGAGARTPVEILAHVGDLMDWALTLVEGRQAWQDSTPLAWPDEVARFYRAIAALDACLSEKGAGAVTAEKLFQGPIADALTHTGQIALLRRMAGCAVKGENYAVADIAIGRTGPAQSPARREF
jgi:hypothetical protein